MPPSPSHFLFERMVTPLWDESPAGLLGPRPLPGIRSNTAPPCPLVFLGQQGAIAGSLSTCTGPPSSSRYACEGFCRATREPAGMPFTATLLAPEATTCTGRKR